MGKFTIERWKCDRCGKVADVWQRPGNLHTLTANIHYDTAGGLLLDWREICVSCNKKVASQIESIRESAKQDRQAIVTKETVP